MSENENTDTKPAEDLKTQARTDQLEAEISSRKAELEQVQAQLQELSDARSKDAARFRDVLAAANPGIPAELMPGDTVEAVAAAFENAQTLVQKVLAANGDTSPPAGGGGRQAPDWTQLSTSEKIRQGIANALSNR